MVSLCTDAKKQDSCINFSDQVGTTEILSATLAKAVKYVIKIEFTDSVIDMHRFTQCPHIQLELSLISTQELALLVQQDSHITTITAEESQQAIKQVLQSLSVDGAIVEVQDAERNRYTFEADPSQELQVIYRQDFEVSIKRGLFCEVFYSPYRDEVLQIAVVQQSDLYRARFKSFKSVWVELQAGKYTLEITSYRQVQDSAQSKSALVPFQLYLAYEPIIASRDIFLPPTLNYYGLLGYKEEIDSVSLFYDDLVLLSQEKQVKFTVQEQSLLAVKLQQESPVVKIKLLEGGKVVGGYQTDINNVVLCEISIRHILTQDTEYTLVLERDETYDSSTLQDKENRDDDLNTFSLKIDFAQVPPSGKQSRKDLPLTIEQVQRIRDAVPPGLKESTFYMGTREVLHLFDNIVEVDQESPYEPQSTKVYQSSGGDGVILSLPFTVGQQGEVIYAAIQDCSEISNIDLVIYSEDHEEVAISQQQKYQTSIQEQSLPQGRYFLVLRSKMTQRFKFMIDVVRLQLASTSDEFWIVEFEEIIQMCTKPVTPTKGLNTIGYLHALSGQSVSTVLDLSILQLDSGLNLPFSVAEDSLVVVYVEVPEDLVVALAIQQNGSIEKEVAISSDQDLYQTNFIHQKGFEHKSAVEIRMFVEPGAYWISAQQVSYEDPTQSFDEHENPCQTYRMYITVEPTAKLPTKLKDQVLCESQQALPQRLNSARLEHGTFITEVNSLAMQVATVELNDSQNLLYFQLDYDMRQEGPWALVLSSYDASYRLFKELAVSNLIENQATILQVVPKGTYAISVQPIASDQHKFHTFGDAIPRIHSQCFTANYTYLVDTIDQKAKADAQLFLAMFGIIDEKEMVEELIILEAEDDIHSLQQFQACNYQKLPSTWPSSDFDQQLALKISKNERDLTVLPITQKSLVKVFIKPRSKQNKVSAQLLDKQGNVLAATSAVNGVLAGFVSEQLQLAFVYEKVSATDQCPLFDARVSVVSLEDLHEEQLECVKHELPPSQISIKDKYHLQQTFAFSSDYLDEFANEEQTGMQYDIAVNFAHSQFMLDVALKTDFATSSLKMILLGKSEGKYHKIAISQWVNEVDAAEFTTVPTDQSQTAFVQRFRFIDQADEKIQDADELIIRLSMGRQELQLVERLKNLPVCFNFELSIFATENLQSYGEIRRVEVIPTKVDTLADVRDKIVLFVEYSSQLDGAPYVWLQKVQAEDSWSGLVYPSESKIKHDNDKVAVLVFNPNTLEAGQCYKIKSADSDFQLCTSKCSCSNPGTSKCDETSGSCICHPFYEGDDCSECKSGYAPNPAGFCVKETKCAELGGTETCQGHGVCEQMGGIARCDCDQGFANDGLIQCGRCADPIFTYPFDCAHSRRYVLSPNDIQCQHLPYEMPHSLTEQTGVRVYDGFLQWSGRYSLKSQIASHSASSHTETNQIRSRSQHLFSTAQPSGLRLFLSSPGVEMKYQIFSKDQVLISQSKARDVHVDFYQLIPKNKTETEYKLIVEYTQIVKQDCAPLEVNLVLEPLRKHQKEIQCTQQELKDALNIQSTTRVDFAKSRGVEQLDIVLSSGLEVQPGQLTHTQDEYVVYSTLALSLTQKGAFTAFIAYRLSDVTLFMNLKHKQTGQLLAVERTELLEGQADDDDNDRVGAGTGLEDSRDDMLSYIQVGQLEPGEYELDIIVPKGHWLYTRQFETCVNFKLVLEHYTGKQTEGLINAVYPSQKLDLNPAEKLELHLTHQGRIKIANTQKEVALSSSLALFQPSQMQDLCKLVNEKDSSKVIKPSSVQDNKERLLITFDFSKRQVEADSCYVLLCENQETRASMFMSSQEEEYRYCFLSKTSSLIDKQQQCNPYSRAKKENGRCVCPEPYAGDLCEACIVGSASKMLNKHTICSATQADLDCNGFGRMQYGKCQCDSLHQGDQCQKCANQKFAYPDCTGDYLADVSSSGYLSGFEEMRRKKVYTQSAPSALMSEFTQECKFNDYPVDLNTIQHHLQFESGNFHFADVFTANHDKDNMVRFEPKTTGLLKIMVKQPELTRTQKETFDIQIAIFHSDQLLANDQNHEIKLTSSADSDFSSRLDYATVELQVGAELVNKSLLVLFRAANFTHTEQDCLRLYLEVQFQHVQAACPAKTSTFPLFQHQLKKISYEQPQELESLYTTQFTEPVLYYQDFHSQQAGLFTVTIEQKFTEHKQIVPLIELVQEDIKFSDFSYYQKDASQPLCQTDCQFIGTKAYNSFTVALEVEANSVVRVWLANVNPYKDDCFSVRVVTELLRQQESLASEEIKCDLVQVMGSVVRADRDFKDHATVRLSKEGMFTTQLQIASQSDVFIQGEPGPYKFTIKQQSNGQVLATSRQFSPVPNTHGQPTIRTMLDQGTYQLVFETKHNFTCNQIKVTLEFQAQSPSLQQTMPLSLISLLTKDQQQWYGYSPILDEKFNIIFEQVLKFDGLDSEANALISVDGPVELVVIRQDSNQAVLNSKQALLESILPTTSLKIIIYAHNYQVKAPQWQQYYRASVKLFSYEQEMKFDYLHEAKIKVHETTPSLLQCKLGADAFQPREIQDNRSYLLDVKPTSTQFVFDYKPQFRQVRIVVDPEFTIELVSSDGNKVIETSESYDDYTELVYEKLQGSYQVRLTLVDVHSFLWTQECRVITLTITGYNSQTAPVGESKLQVEVTDTLQTFVVQQEVKLDLKVGGDIDIGVDVSTSSIPKLRLMLNKESSSEDNQFRTLLLGVDQFMQDAAYFQQTYAERYSDLEPGLYTLRTSEPALISLRQSSKSQALKVKRDTELYQASRDWEGLQVRRMPIDLNSLQFLGMEQEGYLLWSELVELGEIRFSVEQDQTQIRLYIDNNYVKIVHKLDGIEQKNNQNRHIFSLALSRGLHTFTLVSLDEKPQKTQLTISVATPSFLSQYQSFHKEGLSECPSAQFPLALANDQSGLTDREQQSFINYEHLRYPQNHQQQAQESTVTTYYFRFNETQRFYFEVGSHFLSSHLVLKFSQMNREYLVSTNGKQRHNVNFVDLMVAPGDYQLRVIEYASSTEIRCGIYSLKGLLNPVTSMLLSSQKLHSGKCEIKGDYLPDVIYPNVLETKGGDEDFIGQDGSFIKTYSEVLVDQVGELYNHQIELEVKEKAILQLTLIAGHHQHFYLKLVSFDGTVQGPFHKDVVKTSGAEKELTLAWALEPYRSYFLLIQHDNTKVKECRYYDLLVSITTLQYLSQKHRCDQNRVALFESLPEKLNRIPYNLTGTYQLSYPADFEKQADIQGDLETSLVLTTVIDINQDVEISAKLWQQQGLSDFVMGLYEYPKTKKDEGNLPHLVVQTPLYAYTKGHLLGRELRKSAVSAGQKVLFVLQERITEQILTVLYKEKKEPLCLSVGLSLIINPKPRQSAVPMLMSYTFVGDVAAGSSDIIRFAQSTTAVYVEYQGVVMNKDDSDDAQQSFALQIQNDGKTVLSLLANKVKITAQGISLEFKPALDSIIELIKTSQAPWLVKLVVNEPFKTDFKISEDFLTSSLELRPAQQTVIKKEIKEKSKQLEKPASIQAPTTPKCECVHGTCRQGESKCQRCDSGWHGVLCDLPSKFSKAKVIDDDDDSVIYAAAKIADQQVQDADTYRARQKQKQSDSSSTYFEMPKQADPSLSQIKIDQEVGQDQWLDSLGAVLLIGLISVAVYFFRRKAQEKQEKQLKRQKKNDYQGILETEDEDEEVLPLELQVVNRKRQARQPQELLDPAQPAEEQPNIENEIEQALSSDESIPDIELQDVSDDDEFSQFI